jgi:hypothetical protein
MLASYYRSLYFEVFCSYLNKHTNLGVVGHHLYSKPLERLSPEDHEFKASWGNTARPPLRETNT